MDYRDFVCFVQAQMQEKLGEGIEVRLHQIMKNNSVVLDALSINEKGSTVAPTIYLNEYYKQYLTGKSMPELLDEMESIYHRSCAGITFDTSFYNDFEKVKNRLACKLINRKKNEELLKRVPHRSFLDLAVVIYYCFEDEQMGNGTIMVYEEHRKSWNVTEEELFTEARSNTLRIQPEEFLSMESIMQKYFEYEEEEEQEEWEDSIRPMYVLTNRGNYFGAASILFDSVLQKIAQTLEDDFWVLPSSIHECIIVPASLPVEKEELQKMVREINLSEVEEEDFLSDEVYRYRADVHKLSI